MVDIAIRDGTLIDGTGHSSHKTDILIDDGKIDGIGNFPDIEATTNYDASGMVVTREATRMPRVLEATPVISAMLSTLNARKYPDMITPPDTRLNIT